MKASIVKRLSLIALAAVFLFALAACGESNNSSSGSSSQPASASAESASGSDAVSGKKVIRIGYQKGNTLNILKVRGNLEERLKELGIAVEWNVFPSGGAVLEALAAGQIDYGNAADGVGVFAQASDKPFFYVGASLPNPEGIGIMVMPDSGINSIADLKGKTIAVFKGGNHHYLAILALERAGLTVDDVNWVYITDAFEGRAAFETGQVDALGMWDPFFASTQIDLKPVTLTDGADYTPNRTFYFATEDFANNHPELVKILLEETNESDQWANTNKEEVTKLLSEELGIDEESIALMVNRRTYGVELITEEVIAPQQQLADVFHRVGLIDKAIDVRERMPIGAPWNPDNL